MEHLIQFSVSIDDDAITKKVVEQATRQVVNDMTEMCKKELGLSGNYYQRGDFIDKVVEPIVRDCKDYIVKATSRALAERVPRYKWYREMMQKTLKDNLFQSLKVRMTDDAGYVPAYAHEGDAGLDLRSTAEYMIPSWKSARVSTGLKCEIPKGCVGLMFPRSGLGSRGITLRHAVGVIDSGFRGEVLCPLWNTTAEPFHVKKGDRICQLVVVPYCSCTVEEVDELSDSERGVDGYGSTGVK